MLPVLCFYTVYGSLLSGCPCACRLGKSSVVHYSGAGDGFRADALTLLCKRVAKAPGR